jgi:glutamine synthetase
VNKNIRGVKIMGVTAEEFNQFLNSRSLKKDKNMSKTMQNYGELVFSKEVMQDKLSKDVYRKLISTVANGDALDESIAPAVAHAMKEWAIENGATHFTHWFQPLRSGTAEKHDSFITYGENGLLIERFSAGQLVQSEPDASSFPSGGIRATFEARGYTAWDPTSPAFLKEAGKSTTLVIPSVFMSWTGEILDKKTPLMRSKKAIEKSALKLQKLLGNRNAKQITINAGPEQEYFLFSKKLVDQRPDITITGRTLFGMAPARGQQMDDHYFGSIKKDVLNFMEDLDQELFRKGIPSKTRHNEVAPNQFEMAPLYEDLNLAVDHNLLVMDTIADVASKHNLVASVYEKPLAGVNGSGKHLNWSIGDNTGANYLEPSNSPLRNISFLLTLGALLYGVQNYGYLIRTAVADAGNDHRLGANEAPPAIMSVYLGEYLSDILDEIEGTGSLDSKKMSHINLGVQNLPKVAKDYSDRNRTSPIAFTGNKFEVRALGSTQNIGVTAMTLNLLVAHGYEEITKRIESKTGDKKQLAISVLKEIIKETKAVRFEGDGYSAEWHAEAKKRGLRSAKNTPAALPAIIEDKTIELFERFDVMSKRELYSKYDIRLEEYINVKDIEFKTAINMTSTGILPAILEHYSKFATAFNATNSAGFKSKILSSELKKFDDAYHAVSENLGTLTTALDKALAIDDLQKQATALGNIQDQQYTDLRSAVDHAESLVSEEIWPYPSYQRLLLELN